MSRSRFDKFNHFISRRHRLIILAWVVALVLSFALIPTFFASVSYNILGLRSSGTKNTESQTAQNILEAQFPSSNSSGSSILLVVQPSDGRVYSDEIKNAVLKLNQTLSSDKNSINYTGMSSVYSVEDDLLNSVAPEFISGVAVFASNIATSNQGLYALQGNLSYLNSNIFQLQQGINQTAQLIYGIPAAFVGIWQTIMASGQANPSFANQQANSTLYQQTGNFGGDPTSTGYYVTFDGYWMASFQTSPNLDPIQRETSAINSSVAQSSANPALDNQTKALMMNVATGLDVDDWNQNAAIANLTIASMVSQIPSDLASSLGAAPSDVVRDLYDLGPTPSSTALAQLTVQLIIGSSSESPDFPTEFSTSDFSISDLVTDAYELGPSPNSTAIWNLAANFFTNTTASSFSTSPLFTINTPSLYNLITTFNKGTTSSEIENTVGNLIAIESYSNYPLTISTALTKNFVSANNDTMILVFNFSSDPSQATITSFKTIIEGSTLSTIAKTYVTGSPVIAKDFENAFVPVLGLTVVPGIVVSIIIVALLFAAPLAALLPLLMGGLTIVISYAMIYVEQVTLVKGQISFLTPTLTTLLVLGLAVDYSVLQLRRTKEERTKGRSKEESVATSVKWAGQAVLTAGITVIVAYVVMAIVNVPIFSDVGTAIALGVSVLLLASLTLLPSIELYLGDKLFWPKLKIKEHEAKPSLLARISEKTAKRKVAIALIIIVLAAGAFYVTLVTPTGADFLKLIPNFPSNQGLTVITNSLGSGIVAPTEIVVITPTPIVNGDNQFNQTLLNQIELISQDLSSSSGVSSVTGPTRPYGSTFNYTSIQNMTEPLRSQYLSGMFSQIGEDNRTALISVGLASSSESSAAIGSLLKIESKINALPLLQGITVHYGGTTQSTQDNQSFMDNILPEVTIILVASVYVILLLQLRSAFTPLRLVFTILCSVAFSLAILAISFHYVLSLPILNFTPLFVVVTMLGVGIDYDIFYVTRIREEVLNGKSDKEAIKTATTKVWVTILGLGLVLASVFGSLLVTGIAILQEISLAVSAAVLIDVTIVILFFVPALMAIAEKLNWWPSKIVSANRKDANRN